MRQRSGIEPVIGHLKEDGHLERNHLAGTEGDAINIVLCDAVYNMRLLTRWIRLLFALPLAIILGRPPRNQIDHHLAIAA
jgi:IS5 family transposase